MGMVGKVRSFFVFLKRSLPPLFSRCCLLCGYELPGPGAVSRGDAASRGEAASGGEVCPGCREKLPVIPGPSCSHCGGELISLEGLCLRCRDSPEVFASGFSLYRYADGAKELIYQYKKKNCRGLGAFFAGELYGAYFSRQPGLSIVPVPPLRRNVRRRGWDPLEGILRELEFLSGRKALRVLRRLPSLSQKDLGLEERMINMKGKIKLKSRRRPLPPAVFLLDDVWTTGSTLRECAEVLKAAGVREIRAVTLARD